MNDARDRVANYNDVSESLLKKIPKLDRNKTVRYRVYGSYNPKTKKYSLLSALHIPPTDTIYDPEKEDWPNIAMIERVKADGSPQFIELWITDQTNNVLILNGGKARDQKIYRYLELCNFNASNPNRDVGKDKLIEKIDDVANYLAEHEKSEMRRQAFSMVNEWTDEQVIKYWEQRDPSIRIALKASDGKGIDKQYFKYLKARLLDTAESNPERFISDAYGNSGMAEEVSNIISRAKELGLFKLSAKTGKFLWPDGKEMFTYKKEFGVRPYEKLKDYFLRSDQGKKDFELIKVEVV